MDVITGLIKQSSNAFSVASGIDSKTILDTLGAESFRKGDMLFLQRKFLSQREFRVVY